MQIFSLKMQIALYLRHEVLVGEMHVKDADTTWAYAIAVFKRIAFTICKEITKCAQ